MNYLTEGIVTPTRFLPPRMCEYVDHLHEHFKYPVIIKKASYMPPKVSLAREAPPPRGGAASPALLLSGARPQSTKLCLLRVCLQYLETNGSLVSQIPQA